MEKELDSPQTHLSTNSGEEDSDAMVGGRPRGRGGSRAKNRKKFTKKKSTPRIDGRVAKARSNSPDQSIKMKLLFFATVYCTISFPINGRVAKAGAFQSINQSIKMKLLFLATVYSRYNFLSYQWTG